VKRRETKDDTVYQTITIIGYRRTTKTFYVNWGSKWMIVKRKLRTVQLDV